MGHIYVLELSHMVANQGHDAFYCNDIVLPLLMMATGW
jgi:hypothetical protein